VEAAAWVDGQVVPFAHKIGLARTLHLVRAPTDVGDARPEVEQLPLFMRLELAAYARSAGVGLTE